MAYSIPRHRSYGPPSSYFPSAVKWLLIVNTAIFVIYFLAARFGFEGLFYPLGLIPRHIFEYFAVWQLGTYLFLHDPNGFGHILFNMLYLWFFGADLERTWGTRRFLKFYFICGIGAGVCVVLANLMFGGMNTRTIGASGAIYGVLLAFGMLFPDRQVFFFFIPIAAKYLVMILGAIAFLSTLGGPGGGVSHIAHLGGMIFGYLFLKSERTRKRGSPGVFESATRWYREYKLQRAKKKFEVYLRKRDSERDRWVN
jgi:membrane associated rhomboid family serine protease